MASHWVVAKGVWGRKEESEGWVAEKGKKCHARPLIGQLDEQPSILSPVLSNCEAQGPE